MSLAALRDLINPVVQTHIPEEYIANTRLRRKDSKVLRDPIFGFITIRPYEAAIVDSPLFQRLRSIFQTAFAYVAYPSSVHSRFEHSLSCMNLADRVYNSVARADPKLFNDTNLALVRLAGLLHDIGHCLFSHASEEYYKHLPEFDGLASDEAFQYGNPSPGEIANYCIITSAPFHELWKKIKSEFSSEHPYIAHIEPRHIAELIVGRPPDGDHSRRYLADIINGPIDVDKLDYITRDGYFTGVSMSIDIDRLIPSLTVANIRRQHGTGTAERDELSLVVDHKALSVLEQMLFARMLLYDSVYHHHKVRIAAHRFLQIINDFSSKPLWPTPSKTLSTYSDLLSIDEYHFFGHQYGDATLSSLIASLKNRELQKRALVLTARSCADELSMKLLYQLSSGLQSTKARKRSEVGAWLKALTTAAFEHASSLLTRETSENVPGSAEKLALLGSLGADSIVIDFPRPPKYTRMGRLSYILLSKVEDEKSLVVSLSDLFPFEKLTTTYSQQYKYRSYVFSDYRLVREVAYGMFKAMSERSIKLNDLALLMAHQRFSKDSAYYQLTSEGMRPPD